VRVPVLKLDGDPKEGGRIHTLQLRLPLRTQLDFRNPHRAVHVITQSEVQRCRGGTREFIKTQSGGRCRGRI